MTGRLAAEPIRVFTNRGDILYIDTISRELRHGPVGDSPLNAGFVSQGTHGQIVHEARAFLQPIICERNRCRAIESANAGERLALPTTLEVVQLGYGWVGLRAEGMFLCAEPGGQVTLSRTACNAWERFALAGSPHSRGVFDALRLLTPYDVPLTKKRIGRSGDGGYVLIDDFDRVGAVYSIGLGNDVSFDEELAKMGKEIFMFDHTVDSPPASHANFHFFRQGAGKENDDTAGLYTIEHQIRALGHHERSDLILKIDVEGAELEIFPTISRETLLHFRQMVMEIHGLLYLGDAAFRAKFVATLSRINSVFTLVHVHANNWGSIGFVDGFAVADTLELSYVRSDLMESDASKTIYPTMLDFPNCPQRPDFLLWFYPFLPAPKDECDRPHNALLTSFAMSNRALSAVGADGWHEPQDNDNRIPHNRDG